MSCCRRPTLPCVAVLMVAVSVVAGGGCAHRRELPPRAAVAPAPAPPAPDSQLEWANGAAFYEIFVRSFADGNGDGIGDLKGLTAKLDYLNDGKEATTTDLGIEGIWLMPIFASPSYHGYDVTDYESINPDYGTLEDFHTFVTAAHARGIRVVLDLVVNHTSDQHPWFVESASSPRSPKRDWYVWRPDDPGWTQPWGNPGYPTWHEKTGAYYYGIFWSGMPDLNFLNPQVRTEVERIAGIWLERGVDGFRLDAARHIIADGPGELQNDTPGTHAFWKEFSAAVRRRAPQALLIGENWTSTEKIAPYYGSTATVKGGDELPMSFDFPLAEAILGAVQGRDARPVVETLARIAALYPPGVLDGTFLTNHDMVRVASLLGNDPVRLRSAAAVLLTLPGTPFVYYGEEVGLSNGPPDKGDPAKRTPMPWSDQGDGGGFTTGTPWEAFAPGRASASVAVETGDPSSLLSHYRSLIHLRAGSPALRRGGIQVLSPAAEPSTVLAFLRTQGNERLLVAHNLGDTEAAPDPWRLRVEEADLVWSSVPGCQAVVAEGGVRVQLPVGASAVWRLR